MRGPQPDRERRRSPPTIPLVPVPPGVPPRGAPPSAAAPPPGPRPRARQPSSSSRSPPAARGPSPRRPSCPRSWRPGARPAGRSARPSPPTTPSPGAARRPAHRPAWARGAAGPPSGAGPRPARRPSRRPPRRRPHGARPARRAPARGRGGRMRRVLLLPHSWRRICPRWSRRRSSSPPAPVRAAPPTTYPTGAGAADLSRRACRHPAGGAAALAEAGGEILLLRLQRGRLPASRPAGAGAGRPPRPSVLHFAREEQPPSREPEEGGSLPRLQRGRPPLRATPRGRDVRCPSPIAPPSARGSGRPRWSREETSLPSPARAAAPPSRPPGAGAGRPSSSDEPP